MSIVFFDRSFVIVLPIAYQATNLTKPTTYISHTHNTIMKLPFVSVCKLFILALLVIGLNAQPLRGIKKDNSVEDSTNDERADLSRTLKKGKKGSYYSSSSYSSYKSGKKSKKKSKGSYKKKGGKKGKYYLSLSYYY